MVGHDVVHSGEINKTIEIIKLPQQIPSKIYSSDVYRMPVGRNHQYRGVVDTHNNVVLDDGFKLLDDIVQKAFAKISFRASVDEYKEKYVFGVRSFSDNVNDHLKCPNINEKQNNEQVTSLIYGISKDLNAGKTPNVKVIIGDAGSGKSTWIKYNLVVNEEIFFNNKIIPTRFEYKRFYDIKLKSLDSPDFRDYTPEMISHARICMIDGFSSDCIVRDICYYLIHKKWIVKDVFDSNVEISNHQVLDFFRRKFVGFIWKFSKETMVKDGFYIEDEDFVDGLRKVSEFVYSQNNGTPTFSTILHMSDDFKSLLIRFSLSVGFNFIVVYDGFDIISPSDLIKNTHDISLIEDISHFIHRKDQPKIGTRWVFSYKHASIVALRDSTYSLFRSSIEADTNHAKIEEMFYIPPSFKSIFSYRVALLSRKAHEANIKLTAVLSQDQLNDYNDEIVKYYDDLQREISNHFRINEGNRRDEEGAKRERKSKIHHQMSFGMSVNAGQNEFDFIFNHNIRRSLEFCKTFFRHCAYRAHINVRQSAETDRKLTVIPEIFREVSYLVKSRPYVLFRNLTLRDQGVFTNYLYKVAVASNREIDAGKNLKYAQIKSIAGFIDNIYNYLSESHVDVIDLQCKKNRGDKLSYQLLLVKVRILQILARSGVGGVSLQKIVSDLAYYWGYHCLDIKFINDCIGSLLFSEMIKINCVELPIEYQIENHGIACINSIAWSLTYIEQVCLKTYMPDVFASLTEVYKNRHGLPWYADCIPNAYVFLFYVKFAEASEDKNCQMQNIMERSKKFGPKVSDLIFSNLIDGAEKMLSERYKANPTAGTQFNQYVRQKLAIIRNRLSCETIQF